MFATQQYCVTPTKRPIHRMQERATTFLRDVKRRSLRVKRSKSLVIAPAEKRKSGKKISYKFLWKFPKVKCFRYVLLFFLILWDSHEIYLLGLYTFDIEHLVCVVPILSREHFIFYKEQFFSCLLDHSPMNTLLCNLFIIFQKV